MSKQYGLILPGSKNEKATPKFQASRNVFGDESDSDGEQKPTLRPNTKIKKQVKLAQEKVLNEDPTVYQYDELYDDMEIKKQVETTASKQEKRPRYIEKLMESANKRKRENERRMERQVQKEREKEGSEFADKESFVTSAYKEKLAELRAEEEKEKREEYLESIGDVTKQKDLGGFYRHLYEQKLGAEPKKKEETKTSPKPEPTESDNNEDEEKRSQRDRTPSSPPRRSRNYRKRKSSADVGGRELSEGEIISEEEEKVPTLEDIKAIKRSRPASVPNIDADSDFSGHSTDNEDETQNKQANQKDDKSVGKGKSQDKKDRPQDKKDETQDIKEKSDEKKQQDIKNKSENKKDLTLDEFKLPATKSSSPILKANGEPKSPPKPKVDIWKKRTVGVVFEEAMKRYYERKAARSQ